MVCPLAALPVPEGGVAVLPVLTVAAAVNVCRGL